MVATTPTWRVAETRAAVRAALAQPQKSLGAVLAAWTRVRELRGILLVRCFAPALVTQHRSVGAEQGIPPPPPPLRLAGGRTCSRPAPGLSAAPPSLSAKPMRSLSRSKTAAYWYVPSRVYSKVSMSHAHLSESLATAEKLDVPLRVDQLVTSSGQASAVAAALLTRAVDELTELDTPATQ